VDEAIDAAKKSREATSPGWQEQPHAAFYAFVIQRFEGLELFSPDELDR
jgi:hypothetical protein